MGQARKFASPHLAPDKGEFDNDAWVEIVNCMPIGQASWAPMSRMRQVVQITAESPSDLPYGAHVHPGHGSNGWTIYYGTATALYAVDIDEVPTQGNSTESDVSGATYSSTFWQFEAFRNHEIAVGGLTQLPQIRLDGAGSFEDLVTNQEPTPFIIIQGWQEDNSGGPAYVDSTDMLNSIYGEDTQAVFPAGPAVDDAHYFGLSNAATALRIDVATAGTGTHTIVWEYWDGTAWTALSNVDAVNGLTGADIADGENFKVKGIAVITYDFPVDWEETTVNSSRSLFFLRARISVFTDMATVAVLNEADPVTGNWPPRPAYVANFSGRLAIAYINNVSFANASGTNTDGYLLWVSSDNNPRRFGMESDPRYYGERTGFYYLDDNDGPITAMTGGAEFGAVFKSGAAYLVIYDSPLGLEFRQKGAKAGCVYPNSLVWVGDELYFWSSQGPAVMTIDGVRILGIESEGISLVQRTLFDDTWIGGTYPIRSARKVAGSGWDPDAVYATYSKVSDVISFYYEADSPARRYGMHYHRRTSRITFSEHTTTYRGDAPADPVNLRDTQAALMFGAVLANPYSDDTRYNPSSEMVMIGPVHQGIGTDNLAVWMADPDGLINWAHSPKWSTPYLGPARKNDGRPLEEVVKWVRPLIGLNAGASNAPSVTVTVQTKSKTLASSVGSESQAVEDADYGVFRVVDAVPRLYNKITVELCAGDDFLTNLENVSEFDGLEYFTEPGGGP